MFTSGFLLPSGGEAYEANASRTADTACPLGTWGTLCSSGSRMTRRHLALSWGSSSGRCPIEEVLTSIMCDVDPLTASRTFLTNLLESTRLYR